MVLLKRDVVYILKNDVSSDEIKYSIRSVVENFPYRKIVFVGGCPPDLKPDLYIPHEQVGITKWERVRSSLMKVLICDEISDEFFLFNDDFFIIKKQPQKFVNFADGTLEYRINGLKRKVGSSSYVRQLESVKKFLERKQKDSVNFAVHLPFLVSKNDALALLTEYPKIEMFRSFYGNMLDVPYVQHHDVKIYDLESLPVADDFLSTTDNSFRSGAVGEWIRKRFPDPSKYEVGNEKSEIRAF